VIPVKIVGLLKQESRQVYFSEELCNMLSLSMYDNSFRLSARRNILTGNYTIQTGIIPVIGDKLGYGDLKVSTDLANGNDISGDALVSAYMNGEMKDYDAVVSVYYNDSTSRFVEISEEWFYEMYQQKSCQASLYLKDYIHTDYVMKKLRDMGYIAVSPYRVSAGEYDDRLLNERNFTIYMSLIILVMLSALEILIVRSIMKIRNNDFIVLGSIGMNHNTIKMMNYFEMYLYSAASILIVIAAAGITALLGINYLADMIKYYNLFTYAIFITFCFVKITVTVWLFNRYLKHKQKWSRND
jgi:ABC-type antimicrobial peptide transport system permease subunit